MSDLRTAAQQALEALEGWDNYGKWVWPESALEQAKRNTTEALAALRAALAQQAEPTVKESLPVESVVAENATTQQRVVETPPSDYRRGYWDGFNIGKREGRIEAEDAAKQAEPVEPVAWMYTGIKQDGTEHGPHLVWKPEYMDAMSASKGAKAMPLYTAPPQRQPLSEEEIRDLWSWSMTAEAERTATTQQHAFTRAIERAHGITP